MSTGLKSLDQMTGGLYPGLIILAARPTMGIEALCLNIVEHVALELTKPVAYFCTEDSEVRLVMRMASLVSGLPLYMSSHDRLQDEELLRLKSAIYRLNDAPLDIADVAGMNFKGLFQHIRELNEKDELGLIVIDNLQSLMASIKLRNNFSTEEVSSFLCSLKELALDLDVPIIVLSDLPRSIENRNDKRPLNKDLNAMGVLELYANLVLFIYRDEVYTGDTRHKGKAEIILSKNINGSVGGFSLDFNASLSRFKEGST